MVIVQLTTKSKNQKQFYNMRAIKGHVIHFPIPTNATLNNVYKTTLPNTDYFHILVDSLKTTSGKIWQNSVNLKKINSALTVLNKIHKIYQNKIIIKTDLLKDNRITEQMQTNKINDYDISMLTYLDMATMELQSYTTIQNAADELEGTDIDR